MTYKFMRRVALLAIALVALTAGTFGRTALASGSSTHRDISAASQLAEASGAPNQELSRAPKDFQPHRVIACTPNQYVLEQQAPHMRFYWLRVPHWLNQQDKGCVRTYQRTNFTVTRTPPPAGDVTMYPDEIWGCEWGICTPHSPLPIQVKNIHRMHTTWINTKHRYIPGMFNVAYDIWLTNKRDINGRHDGVELMVWLRHKGGCCWTKGTIGFPKLGRYRYRLMTRFMTDTVHHARWRFIEWRMIHQVWKVEHMNLGRIIKACVRRGLISPNQWVESVGAGYEIWDGAVGMQTRVFSVHMNGV